MKKRLAKAQAKQRKHDKTKQIIHSMAIGSKLSEAPAGLPELPKETKSKEPIATADRGSTTSEHRRGEM